MSVPSWTRFQAKSVFLVLIGATAAVAVGAAVWLRLPDEANKAEVPAVPSAPAASGASGASSAPLPAGAAAKVCDSRGLAGPKTAPDGAVTVTTSQNLDELMQQHDAGTTYWLTPGVHRFGQGEFDQIRPLAGDTFVGAPGAIIDGQHKNRYAFVGTAKDVTIKYLTVQNFGSPGGNPNEGVVNHDSGTGWTISHLTVQRNAGAGVMLGDRGRLTDSCLRANGQYGFQGFAEDGASGIEVRNNEVSGNNTDDWEKRQEGCGCTGGAKFWDVTGATVAGNYVHDNHGVGLWADSNNSGFLFEDNYIVDNDGEGIMYELSYNAEIVDNTFVRNALKSGPQDPGFPTGAVYISEAGSDKRVPGRYGSSLRISGNTFIDNWAGVVAWENADRFAGSEANTSTGMTTMVNPAATIKACSTPSQIAKQPLLNDCRWRTQNLDVSGNTFELDPKHIPKCSKSNSCGMNALFSQVGSYPDWSPYNGYVVPDNITFKQHNTWSNNSYRGPWKFLARLADNELDWDAWRAAPYGQDKGSKFLPAP